MFAREPFRARLTQRCLRCRRHTGTACERRAQRTRPLGTLEIRSRCIRYDVGIDLRNRMCRPNHVCARIIAKRASRPLPFDHRAYVDTVGIVQRSRRVSHRDYATSIVR
jgi:hypothetical protein